MSSFPSPAYLTCNLLRVLSHPLLPPLGPLLARLLLSAQLLHEIVDVAHLGPLLVALDLHRLLKHKPPSTRLSSHATIVVPKASASPCNLEEKTSGFVQSSIVCSCNHDGVRNLFAVLPECPTSSSGPLFFVVATRAGGRKDGTYRAPTFAFAAALEATMSLISQAC